jgi:hypothetical protein
MDKREIHGKPVYIFDSHNVALAAWAEIKASHDEELLLLTFDHHTDTHDAFVRYACLKNGKNMVGIDPIMDERLSRIDWRDKQSVHEAVNDLNNDEQIDAALKLGLFSYAFCFNNEHRNANPKETQAATNERIYLIAEECDGGCEEKSHADQVLESALLVKLISRASGMGSSVGVDDVTKAPYVLDIDLDYFKKRVSLSPKDARMIHGLIRGAVGITIATEPHYVRSGRIDGELTSDYARYSRRVLPEIPFQPTLREWRAAEKSAGGP